LPIFLGSAARQRFIRLDDELAHPTLEVDVLENAGHRPRRRRTLCRLFRAHLAAKPEDLPHLLAQVHPTGGIAVSMPVHRLRSARSEESSLSNPRSSGESLYGS